MSLVLVFTSMIKWDDKYSVGISIIDKQHKRLVSIINDAIVVRQHSGDPKMVLEILDEMTKYAQDHFKTEESYMKEFHYPEYQLHQEEHINFSYKTISYRNKVISGDSQIANEILEYLTKWLFNHILVTDKKFVDCFKKNGLK
ncbi:MAG: hemerythrin family protein [Candidatus Scalindua sp.]|jgi:hemerythrin|nr:hemerythrin family protein [Candidatus Scalindua sp.]